MKTSKPTLCFKSFEEMKGLLEAQSFSFPNSQAFSQGDREENASPENPENEEKLFKDAMQGVTPILTAVPPEETHQGKDDSHGGNPVVRARVGMPEHVMWAYDRPDGGRGFGFTGGHYHKNWGDPNFRKLALNAILWIAKADVPEEGVDCTVNPEELKQNLDAK